MKSTVLLLRKSPQVGEELLRALCQSCPFHLPIHWLDSPASLQIDIMQCHSRQRLEIRRELLLLVHDENLQKL